MAFETKEQILEKLLEEEKPKCPHCEQEMNLWEVPPVNFSDGLGWGTPYLYICFNDECSMYQEGWDNMRENYGRNSSYRCMQIPGENHYECMPVFSPEGASGQVIDDEVVLQQEMLKEATKKGFSILADCYNDNDGIGVLRLLTDATEPMRVRAKAAEMIGDIGALEAIDPLRGLKFGNPILQEKVDASIKKIHERNFTRECPFCAEIIKQRAKVCKHCGKDVAGE
jgi:ribosomal protein L37AE/L43A